MGMNLEGPHQIGRNIALDWIQFINLNELTRKPNFCVLTGMDCDSLYNWLMNTYVQS